MASVERGMLRGSPVLVSGTWSTLLFEIDMIPFHTRDLSTPHSRLDRKPDNVAERGRSGSRQGSGQVLSGEAVALSEGDFSASGRWGRD